MATRNTRSHLTAARETEFKNLIHTLLKLTDETLKSPNLPIFEQIHSYGRSFTEWFPKWYLPLLNSPQGHRILARLNEYFLYNLGTDVDSADLMLFCLAVQAAVQTEPADKLKQSLEVFAKMPLKLVFNAIVHYLHPDQTDALAKLIASMPTPPPAMPQFNVPTEALPLLFPTVDTTLFNPQFDWLMYFIAQYCPINKDDYNNKLAPLFGDITTSTSPLSLKPELSLDKTLVHNHLLNSYDEYLAHKLPHLPPRHHLLFPYFPNPHPILRPVATKTELTHQLTTRLDTRTDDFMHYVRLLFILGPAIFSPAGIPLTIPDPSLATFSHLRVQVFNYQYRAWHRQHQLTHHPNSSTTSTAATVTAATSTTIAASDATQPSPPPSPPDFTANPLGLLQLTLLPVCSRAPNLALNSHQHLPDRFKAIIPQLILLNQSHYHFLFLLVDHCFADPATRAELHTDLVDLLLHHSSSSEAKIKLSHTLYQHGYPTLHQFAYRKLTHNIQHSIHSPANATIIDFFKSALMNYETREQFALLTAHLTLCVHAGLLAPPPLPSASSARTSSTTTTTAPSPLDETYRNCPQSTILFHNFLTLRALLHAVLLRLTGLIMYFPGSTQLLGSAISAIRFILTFRDDNLTVTSQRASAPRDIPLLPPHSIPDPCDQTPNLYATLVDDDGELFAIKYGPRDTKKQLQEQQQLTPWWAAHFPAQSGPRHKHLLHGAAIDDFRVGIKWSQYQIEQQVGLNVGTNCNPYDRPRIPAADLAWIGSKENRTNMKLAETRALQKQLTAYYRQVKAVETDLVASQMQKVLRKADQVGLFTAHQPQQQPQQQQKQQKSYPLPTFPSLNIAFGKYLDRDELGPIRTRGEVLWSPHDNYFYDHSYRPTSVYLGDKTPQQLHLESQSQYGDEEEGRMTTADAVAMHDYFRQRSEWALELLIVGSFGLQSDTSSHSRSPTPQPQSQSQLDPPTTDPDARFQYCKEHALQHFPALLGVLQPTPSNLANKSPTLTRLTYFHDMLSHFILLTTIPLYETLVTLSRDQPQ